MKVVKSLSAFFEWDRPGRVIVLTGLAHMETDSLQMSPNLAGVGSVAWLGRRLE